LAFAGFDHEINLGTAAGLIVGDRPVPASGVPAFPDAASAFCGQLAVWSDRDFPKPFQTNTPQTRHAKSAKKDRRNALRVIALCFMGGRRVC
jgi:hypothetical protein